MTTTTGDEERTDETDGRTNDVWMCGCGCVVDMGRVWMDLFG